MTQSRSTPTTLLGLLTAPDDRTALISPDQNIRITYGGLRKQVQDVAAALAAAGVKRISLATSLYRAAMTGLIEAAREVQGSGTFGFLDRSASTADLLKLMQI